MIIEFFRKVKEKKPWDVRICTVDEERHNHSCTVYIDGRVKANRLATYIRDHIRELSVTSIYTTCFYHDIDQA